MDVKLGGFFSEFAYYAPGQASKLADAWEELKAAGWYEQSVDEGRIDKLPAFGYRQGGSNGAYRVFVNKESRQIVFAFKGTNNNQEWADDLANGGQDVIASLVGRATTDLEALRDTFEGYSVSAVGHSLGGGAAQTFAVVNNTDAYFYNSLPLSESTLGPIAQARGESVAQLIADYKALGVRYVATNYQGDIAGTYYRTMQSKTYLDGAPSAIDSNVNETAGALAILGLVLSANPPARLALALIGFVTPKALVHPMAKLNAAMANLSVDPVSGRVIGANVIRAAPDSLPADQEPQLIQSTAGIPSEMRFDDGSVLRIGADGTITAETYDESGQRISEFQGSFGEDHWQATHYDADGNAIATLSGDASEQEAQLQVEQNGTTTGQLSVSYDASGLSVSTTVEGTEVRFAPLPDGKLVPTDIPTIDGQPIGGEQTSVLIQALISAGVGPEDFLAPALDDGRRAEAEVAADNAFTLSFGYPEKMTFGYDIDSSGAAQLETLTYAGKPLEVAAGFIDPAAVFGELITPSLLLSLNSRSPDDLLSSDNKFDFQTVKDEAVYELRFDGDAATVHVTNVIFPFVGRIDDLQWSFYPRDADQVDVRISAIGETGHQSHLSDGLNYSEYELTDGLHVFSATEQDGTGYFEATGTQSSVGVFYPDGRVFSEGSSAGYYSLDVRFDTETENRTTTVAYRDPSGTSFYAGVVHDSNVSYHSSRNDLYGTGFSSEAYSRTTNSQTVNRTLTQQPAAYAFYSDTRNLDDLSTVVEYHAGNTAGWQWQEVHNPDGSGSGVQTNPFGEEWAWNYDAYGNGSFRSPNGIGFVRGASIFFTLEQIDNQKIEVQRPFGYTPGRPADTFSLDHFLAPITDLEPTVDPQVLTLRTAEERALSTFATVSDLDTPGMQQFEIRQVIPRDRGAFAKLNGSALDTSESVTFDSLASISIEGGETVGLDEFWLRAFDGQLWSTWAPITVRTGLPEAHPIRITGGSLVVTQGESESIESFYSLDEQDPKPRLLEFRDETEADGSGFLEYRGTKVVAGRLFDIAADEVPHLKLRGASQPGADDISVRVLNGEKWSSWASLHITTKQAEMNEPPVLSAAIEDFAANAGSNFVLSIPDSTFLDPDSDAISYSLTGLGGDPLPAWLTFNPVTLRLSGAPEDTDVGVSLLALTATDSNGASASQTFTVTVANTNRAPVLASPIADALATEDAPLTLSLPAGTFSDADASDTLLYSASLIDGAALPTWLSFDARTQTFSGTPLQPDVGALEVRITATDHGGLSAQGMFELHVVNVNDAPVLIHALADTSALEDVPFSLSVPNDAFSDEDASDALLYEAKLASGSPLPGWLSFDNASRTFSGTPVNQDVGSVMVQVSATDLAGASASTTFVLTTLNVNDTPTVSHSVPDLITTEDHSFSFVVPPDTFGDVDDGDTLTLSACRADGSALPSWLGLQDGNFAGTPGNADVGSYYILLTATDTVGSTASDVFRLDVQNVNDAPTVAHALTDRAFDAGTAFIFTVPGDTFADEDGGDSLRLDAMLYGGSPLPAWLTFNSATAAFSGNPSSSQTGIFRVVVTATDVAGTAATSDFALTLRASAGSSVFGGTGNDVLAGGTGNETLSAKGGNDYLYGDLGDDVLKGGAGSDVLQGGQGADVLRGGGGQNVLDGGSGNDVIYGGTGSSLIVGGSGNDLIHTGQGKDVILFNRRDGVDTLFADGSADNTLSFGGGIRYSDLRLAKDGKDLVVDAGGGDRLLLKDWYGGKKSVLDLQIVADASADFDASSSDPLRNRRVQNFDFVGIVNAFDQARKASPGLTSWAVTNALLQFHLSGSNDAALGGDLAYWYGKNGSLAGMSIDAAQQVIGAAGFGSDAQTLHQFSGLQDGLVRLN